MLTLRQQLEYAWAAGFIDGEGSFIITYGREYKGGPRDYSRPLAIILTVPQVRREPLERLQNLMGGRIGGPYGGSKRPNPVHHYSLRWGLLKDHIEHLLPHLSAPKVEMWQEKWAQVEAVRCSL